jgi:hypothetical protein
MDRLAFMKTLAGLSPADFEFFVATIPDAARQVSRQGTIPEKVAELIRWTESTTGPGIDAVQEAYRRFLLSPTGEGTVRERAADRSRRAESSAGPDGDTAPIKEGATRQTLPDPSDLYEQAGTALRDGRYAETIRLAFLALVAWLERRGLLRYPGVDATQKTLEQLSPGPSGKGQKAPAGPIPLFKVRGPQLTASVIGAVIVVGALAYLVSAILKGPPATPKETGSHDTPDNRKVERSESRPKDQPVIAVLEGFVKDAETGQFLEGVELSLPDYNDIHGQTPSCRTDPKGRFRFRDLPASLQPTQRVRLVASKDGRQIESYTSLGTTAEPVLLPPATTPEHQP